jgi:hypothetical protein
MTRTRFSPSIMLWASAFILAGMIVLQSGRSGSTEARADLVASAGGVTLMTVRAAPGEDLLLVIEGHREELFIYRVEDQRTTELQRRYSLPQLFAEARAQGAPRR